MSFSNTSCECLRCFFFDFLNRDFDPKRIPDVVNQEVFCIFEEVFPSALVALTVFLERVTDPSCLLYDFFFEM